MKPIAILLMATSLASAWSLMPKTTEQAKQDSISSKCTSTKAYMLWATTLGRHKGQRQVAVTDSLQKEIDFWCGQVK